MQDLMILASALASIIVLMTLAKINRELEKMSSTFEGHSKGVRSRIENIHKMVELVVNRGGKPSSSSSGTKWKA